jgi:hypothetical protein
MTLLLTVLESGHAPNGRRLFLHSAKHALNGYLQRLAYVALRSRLGKEAMNTKEREKEELEEGKRGN